MTTKRHMPSGEEGGPGQLRMWAGCWDLSQGDHPHLSSHLAAELSSLSLFPSAEECQAVGALGLPLTLASSGHHVLRDNLYQHAAGGQDEYPLSPLFVRDMAGRVIHTGLMPLPTPPSLPLFPVGCMDVPATAGGAEFIENALFLLFRRLEIAPTQGVGLAGQPELLLRAAYSQPSTYPYKLRVDTFYQDGWRLPQVLRVFARPVAGAEAAAEEFLTAWKNRPQGQDYENFYEQNNGAQWYEDFFLRGVTVIPTLEGCNGRYHVAEDYTVQDVDPGRAIAGLHQVVGTQPSNMPKDTILQVVNPGYVTATHVQVAEVIVSDGSGFQQPEAPIPFIPNLALPHSRLSPAWGAVWVPTHPAHFAEPALWDWDVNGHFIQMSGPLWDPLHYTYASTPSLVRAMRKPLAENPALFMLPESFRTRFHPVVPQTWYDTVNERTAQEREQNLQHPLRGSALDQVALMKTVATIGYHPMPLALEYELDPAVFPQLHPAHRVEKCPEELSSRVVGLAKLMVEPDQLARHHVVVGESLREVMESAGKSNLLTWWNGREPSIGPESDNPATQLALQSAAAPAFLPEIPVSQLLINVKRLFANRSYRQALQKQSPGLASALFRFREAGLSWRRLRYRLFSKYAAAWVEAWAQGVELISAENRLSDYTPEQHAQVQQVRSQLLTVQLSLQVAESTTVPAAVAGGLRLGAGASKLKPKSKQSERKRRL